jgi:hypothetical protein
VQLDGFIDRGDALGARPASHTDHSRFIQSVGRSHTTLVDGDPANTSLEVSTDASSAISTWSWVVLGPEASISARILTQNLFGLVFDSVHFGDNAPPFQGFAGLLAAEVANDPGTWSETPEPSYPVLLSIVLFLVIERRFG